MNDSRFAYCGISPVNVNSHEIIPCRLYVLIEVMIKVNES